NDAVGRARAAQQAPQVEQQRAGHHDQGDAGCGIDHSKISISGLSYRSFMRRTAVSASSTSRSWTSRLRRSPLRFADTVPGVSEMILANSVIVNGCRAETGTTTNCGRSLLLGPRISTTMRRLAITMS